MVVEIKRRFRIRPVGFRFDAMAVWLMCQQYGVDLNRMNEIPEKEYLDTWIWSAHKSFCVMRYRKPMTFEKMKRFIRMLRKYEWDLIIGAMNTAKAETDDKKKAQHGEIISQQAGVQE